MTTLATRIIDGLELPAAGRWEIDRAHSAVGFWVRHLGLAKVRGAFTTFEGSADIAESFVDSTVSVSIEAASIETRDEYRDQHLRSADFLDVANHPALTFHLSGINGVGVGVSRGLEGILTIRGVSRPVVLDTTLLGVVVDPDGHPRAILTARTEIDRTHFGLTWNQTLETGGVLVGKQVHIEIDVELVKSG